MQTEQRIVKITGKNESCYIGEAENMTWDVYLKIISNKVVNIGDFIKCYILHDEDNDVFYMEEVLNAPLSNQEQWEAQELTYK